MANRSILSLKNDNGVEETPTLIDRKDNVFIIFNFKSKYPVLQLDLRLISDLVVVIVSATCGGIAFACAGQPIEKNKLTVALEVANKSASLNSNGVLENDNGAEETPTLIDRKDNVFIISNFKSKYPVLHLDLRLISDLVVVIVSATCGGIAFACAGQPVITGYLLAGSVVGPGGLDVVSKLVQVETVAQFRVNFLLFALGLEFSMAKSSDKLGLSLELGLFTAGVMISTTKCLKRSK
ncbi:hypothetical protein L2E82_01388 [Cichorium intybus]|uniref:Uncharacterized protein n=1 Tax=Cichorium intybus TaxID=13427 RepID=A0ACB9GZF0_CICIN|nr:hypothetical protein L2E82_01388 [Cichorium intybus]